MDVETRGNGDPVLTVIGGVHGDEPCGPRGIERVLSRYDRFEEAARFIVANEEALEQRVRYCDADLNRVFPGNPDSDMHEERLAARLKTALEPPVLDLHSTESFDEPFATVPAVTPETVRMARATGTDRVVAFSPPDGDTLLDHVTGAGVECGLQQTDSAVENAERIIRNVLATLNAIDEPTPDTDPVLFRVNGTVQKQEPHRLLADNFERVEQGEVFAEGKDSGEQRRADAPFYPILMSEGGYEDILGFTAERVGPLSDVIEGDNPS